MSLLRSALASAALLLPLGGAAVGTAPVAVADGCSAAEVAVLVDFASLGGGVQTGCTGGDPASGVEALQAAGFPPTRAAAERSGYFVCRIAGQPADDPCQRASPAGATWSYWHGEPGGTWTYSGQGAGAYDPSPGTVEGWSFGAGDPPSAPPPRTAAAPAQESPAAPAPAIPAPAPAAPAPAAPLTKAPLTKAPAAPAPPPSSAAPLAPTGVASPTVEAPAGEQVSASPSATASATATSEPVAAAPSSGSSDDAGGGLVAALSAGGVVLLLTGGALLQARRWRGEV